MKVAGIYQIVAPDGAVYVGSSKYIVGRFCAHRSQLRKGNHHSGKLQHAADVFGVSALKFETIFCTLPGVRIVKVEQEFLDAIRPSMNTMTTAKAASQDAVVAKRISIAVKLSAAHTAARVQNQAKAAKSLRKSVVRLTDGCVFPSTYEAAREHNSRSPDNLSTAIRNGNRFAGHYWAFEGCDVTLEQRIAEAQKREACGLAQSISTRVEQTRRSVRRVADGLEFRSIADAARFIGMSHTGIVRALKTDGNFGGSKWAYV